MVLYNLYLVLNNERVVIFDNATQSIVYEGSSENIPLELMCELVHDLTMLYQKNSKQYFLININ